MVNEGDKLQTGVDGRAEVKLSNGNILVLQANTELAFTTMRYDEKSGDFENTFDMAVGEVLGVVEKINKKSTFQLRTPTAVSGVRGTFIKVLVDPPSVSIPKPQTQVFFEGGNGIVTSVMSGQTKEIFAGQNVLIDNVGKIAPPVITSSEQRTTMVHTWTMGQTVNNYSTAKGFSGPGGQMNSEKMPPPPPPPMQKPMMMFPPIINQDMKNTDLTSTVTRPAEIPIFYRIPLNTIMGTSSQIVSSQTNMNFSMKVDGTWHAAIQASYAATLPSGGWSMNFRNQNGDNLTFNNIAVGLPLLGQGGWGPSTPGGDPLCNFDGIARGPVIDKNLALDVFKGSFANNKFVADAYGTWTDVPPSGGSSGP